MIVMLDNYDSFTYNIVQYLGELQADVHVVRNDQISVAELAAMQPQGIVISPGPGTPSQAGITVDVIKQLAGRLPILGVCLGHQALGQAFGGEIVRAHEVVHGKTAPIYHHGEGVFTGLPSPFTATRYHSLVVAKNSLPKSLKISAWTQTENGEMDEIMGLIHPESGAEGVQFHPESIFSEHGHALLDNFLNRCHPPIHS